MFIIQPAFRTKSSVISTIVKKSQNSTLNGQNRVRKIFYARTNKEAELHLSGGQSESAQPKAISHFSLSFISRICLFHCLPFIFYGGEFKQLIII